MRIGNAGDEVGDDSFARSVVLELFGVLIFSRGQGNSYEWLIE